MSPWYRCASPPVRRASCIWERPDGPFNWLAARRTGGRFLLRIEDTDQGPLRAALPRRDPRGPPLARPRLGRRARLHQSRRFDIYRAKAEALVAAGLAYREGEAILFRIVPGRKIAYDDLIHGRIEVEYREHQGPGPDQVGRLAGLQFLLRRRRREAAASPISSAATTTSPTPPSRLFSTRPSGRSAPLRPHAPHPRPRRLQAQQARTAASPLTEYK
ncbi:MAG: glutamate--tRNA ligase family protein, partial [Ignavibacteriales bacterium]|nr:glutamate--tRNA ligase family protein [Ignavibacteriales bacterium]